MVQKGRKIQFWPLKIICGLKTKFRWKSPNLGIFDAKVKLGVRMIFWVKSGPEKGDFWPNRGLIGAYRGKSGSKGSKNPILTPKNNLWPKNKISLKISQFGNFRCKSQIRGQNDILGEIWAWEGWFLAKKGRKKPKFRNGKLRGATLGDLWYI